MSNIFQSVTSPKKRYNNFPLSAENLCSGQIGKLIPVQCDEIVPGDRFSQSVAFLIRFTPLSAPAMARFNVHFHTFYVPYRIITETRGNESRWELFIKSIGKPTEEVPRLPFFYNEEPIDADYRYAFSIGSLADYLGFPVFNDDSDNNLLPFKFEDRITAMPFLAYQKIYNDFYRRDQLEAELAFPVDFDYVCIGQDEIENVYYSDPQDENQRDFTPTDLFALRTRNYERDYFTSALPEPQFGDDVIVGDGLVNWVNEGRSPSLSFVNPSLSYIYMDTADISIGDANVSTRDSSLTADRNGSYTDYWSLHSSGDRSEFSGTLRDGGEELAQHLRANTFTINEFRLAMQLQGLREKINRTGTRYLEIMRGVYGVTVPDARLQRPIYLGGTKSPITIGTVVQTSETAETPQGTLTGKMTGSGTAQLLKGNYEFKEHGYLITIMSITPRTSYYGGMPRKYMKKYPEDFYIPDYDHLGEQEIKKGELCWHSRYGEADVDVNELFGYTPRYAEYKSKLSSVHGEFRRSLDNWHVSRDFDDITGVNLNSEFIKADPRDFERIFEFQNIEGTSNEHFEAQIYFATSAKRNMSKYSTPFTLY